MRGISLFVVLVAGLWTSASAGELISARQFRDACIEESLQHRQAPHCRGIMLGVVAALRANAQINLGADFWYYTQSSRAHYPCLRDGLTFDGLVSLYLEENEEAFTKDFARNHPLSMHIQNWMYRHGLQCRIPEFRHPTASR